MGRKKKLEDAMGGVPVCAECEGPLERLMTKQTYECDICEAEIPTGALFFGCAGCDYSLCGSCYVNKGVEAAEAAEQTADYDLPEGMIHPEIWAFGEEYDIEERCLKQLNELMQTRRQSWRADIDRLKFEMRHARNVKSYTGLLCGNLRKMREGTFIGMIPPDPKVAKVIKQYQLDQDAREKLTDFLQKREREGWDWEKDLWETEQRLISCNNPSMMALTMVVKLQKGLDLPPVKPVRPEDRYDERHNRVRSRTRSRERRQRLPSEERYGGGSRSGRDDRRDGDRHRDRGRDDQRSGGYRTSRDEDRGGGYWNQDRGRNDRGGRDDRGR